MTTLRIDRGQETVQMLHAPSRREALEDFRQWLDNESPETLEGIQINRSRTSIYTLTFRPFGVKDGDHLYDFDQWVDAREMLISRAAQDGDHWI